MPIVQAYAGVANVSIETRDLSLAGRILSIFPERLRAQRKPAHTVADLRGVKSGFCPRAVRP
ncbi:MAG: NADP-dependent isocitrate dehydrogenase [Aurantimicrobium sp.]|nr:NADP-dependent isocitrate dehydrogenase [Aurantimicrobium sp.]